MRENTNRGHTVGSAVRPRRRQPINVYVVSAVAAVLVIGIGAILLFASMRSPVLAGPAASGTTTATPETPSVAPPPEAAAVVEPEPEPEPEPQHPIAFDAGNAMTTIGALESFGVRTGGSDAEYRALQWLQGELEALGYETRLEDVPLSTGATSHNLVARAAGSSERVVVIGGHVDSKPPSPGANDNASGCAAILEIARILAEQPVIPTVEFVFFGTEEIIDGNPDHHHFGSRVRVENMTAAERASTAGMISVDMIAYGPDFHSRMMRRGPEQMSDIVLAKAAETGVRMTFLKDTGKSGWSDHEAYELAGIPATWIEWRNDPVYHTARDTSDHCDPEKVRVAGQLVLDVLRSLDADTLESLVAR